MQISEKQRLARRENMRKLNEGRLNIHSGELNIKWNGGNRLKGQYPCPNCKTDRICEKRDKDRWCKQCRPLKRRGIKTGKMKDTSRMIRGEKHWNWRGGTTIANHKLRASYEYREWRSLVFQRDNYTCQECGERGGKLNADHIKPFAYFPDLRFELSNGRTLCEACHKETDSYGVQARLNYGWKGLFVTTN